MRPTETSIYRGIVLPISLILILTKLRSISHSSQNKSHLNSSIPNMTIVEMRVHMDCAGCESKIKKALRKLDGVDDIDIEMGMQKVTVTGWVDQKKVLKAVRKTGRRAELWPFPYNPDYHHYYYHQHHHQSNPFTYYTSHPSSSYNYYKHGYDGHDHDYYPQPVHSRIINEGAGYMFSDDNPNACAIM